MSEQAWNPPSKIEELYAATAGNNFASINSPVAGARTEQPLPEGGASFQLYSLATPNGQKVSIMLEELGIDYDAHVINIGKGDQFTSGFVSINPNSKIPAAVDKDGPGGQSITLFESASIVMYLAEKYNRFMPTDPRKRIEAMHWIFWQMAGQGPMTGNFGHFMVYAPADQIQARNYGCARYGMEVQRLCSVLDKQLEGKEYILGDEYTVADIMIFPWARQVVTGYKHTSGIAAADFLTVSQYTNMMAWVDRVGARPAVQRGITVCSFSGVAKPWLSAPEASGK
eukprot:gene9537-19830_t